MSQNIIGGNFSALIPTLEELDRLKFGYGLFQIREICHECRKRQAGEKVDKYRAQITGILSAMYELAKKLMERHLVDDQDYYIVSDTAADLFQECGNCPGDGRIIRHHPALVLVYKKQIVSRLTA